MNAYPSDWKKKTVQSGLSVAGCDAEVQHYNSSLFLPLQSWLGGEIGRIDVSRNIHGPIKRVSG